MLIISNTYFHVAAKNRMTKGKESEKIMPTNFRRVNCSAEIEYTAAMFDKKKYQMRNEIRLVSMHFINSFKVNSEKPCCWYDFHSFIYLFMIFFNEHFVSRIKFSYVFIKMSSWFFSLSITLQLIFNFNEKFLEIQSPRLSCRGQPSQTQFEEFLCVS